VKPGANALLGVQAALLEGLDAAHSLTRPPLARHIRHLPTVWRAHGGRVEAAWRQRSARRLGDVAGCLALHVKHPARKCPHSGLDLGFYAARSYSLRRPPRTGWRVTRFWERSSAGWSGLGGRGQDGGISPGACGPLSLRLACGRDTAASWGGGCQIKRFPAQRMLAAGHRNQR
jgi:hypothetical protein